MKIEFEDIQDSLKIIIVNLVLVQRKAEFRRDFKQSD